MLTFKKVLQRAFVASLMGCLGAASLTSPVFAEDLTIGSQAPTLDIEHWVHDGNGKFKPVTDFAKGKVYVVEFWATWCGPCIASMPHLVEMQNKFADKGVQIVSISDESLETVDKFLEREYKATATKKSVIENAPDESGDQPKTYRELTSAYCLTTDPDKSANKDYMQAAGQNGIPCAFIVGKDQKIEWIGHPMSMDDVLAQVVDDKWDRTEFAEEFKESQKMGLLMSKIMRSARSGKIEDAMQLIDETLAETKSAQVKNQLQSMKVQMLMQSGKTEEAMAALDNLIEAEKNPAIKKQMKMTRVQLLMQDTKNAKFAEAITQAYAEYKDTPAFINFITWGLYEKFESGELSDKALLKASRAAAEGAAAASDEASKAAVLDTAAHFQFLDGDTAAALKTQQEAVKLAGDQMKPDLEKFLEVIKEKADK